MASSVIKRPNNRVIKYFDVAIPNGSQSYNFSTDAPSDYSANKRLCAISIAGDGVNIIQLNATTLYFESALQNVSTVRIVYYVD